MFARLLIAAMLALTPTLAHANLVQFVAAGSGPYSGPTVANSAALSYQSGGCPSGCAVTITSTATGAAIAVHINDYVNSGSNTYAVTGSGITCSTVSGANSGNYNGGSSVNYGVWIVCANTPSGVTSITITTANSNGVLADVIEISGALTSGITEAGSGAHNASSSVTCTVTPTGSQELILAGAGTQGGSGAFTSPTSPWVAISGTSSFSQGAASAGAYSGTFTRSGASEVSCAGLAIK